MCVCVCVRVCAQLGNTGRGISRMLIFVCANICRVLQISIRTSCSFGGITVGDVVGSIKVVAVATTSNNRDTGCASWELPLNKQVKMAKKITKHPWEQLNAKDKITSVTLR